MIKLETFRDAVGLTAGDELDLKLLRATVISMWEAATKRLWNARTGYEEDINIGAETQTRQSLWLSLWPITTITSIEERDADEDWETVDSDEYTRQGRRQIIRNSATSYRFWKHFVRVTYDGGASEVDEDIQMALIVQAKFMRTRMAKEQITLQSQNFEGGAGVMLRADFHPLFKQMVKIHKKKS